MPQVIETPYFTYAITGDTGNFAMKGDWSILNLSQLESQVDALDLARSGTVAVDFQCGGLEQFDLSGAWLLYRTAERLRDKGLDTRFEGFRAEHLQFIEDVLNIEKSRPSSRPIRTIPKAIWDISTSAIRTFSRETHNRGLWFMAIGRGIISIVLNPRKFRWIATARHIQDAGISALGIVALMAFLVALVLGFQGRA